MGKLGRANILITSVQVPFTRGGAEILVDGLKRELEARDFGVDIVQLPFNAQPKEQLIKQVALWRALDLKVFNGKKVDLVIGTKFPSYCVSHPTKVLWLIHQHRQMYELYGSRYGDFEANARDEALRHMLVDADLDALKECQGVYTISPNVSARLKRYLDIEGTALTPPLPLGRSYHCGEKGNYILSVGRLCSIKRVDMIIKAFPNVHESLKLKIVGTPDEPAYDTYLKSEIDKHHLWPRIEFMGRVDDKQLLSLYANAFGVFYAPFDEDYGFVTLEALASGKPLISATDSGGTLAFIQDEKNGLVVEPTPEAVAQAINRLQADNALYSKLASAASDLTNSWDEIIDTLTAPLRVEQTISTRRSA